MVRWLPLLALFACGDGPDEWTCEVAVSGAKICIDLDDRKTCEKDLGGEATASEEAPGGPYTYCDDLFEVACPGSVIQKGDGFTANLSYYAATDEDCAAADGATLTD